MKGEGVLVLYIIEADRTVSWFTTVAIDLLVERIFLDFSRVCDMIVSSPVSVSLLVPPLLSASPMRALVLKQS